MKQAFFLLCCTIAVSSQAATIAGTRAKTGASTQLKGLRVLEMGYSTGAKSINVKLAQLPIYYPPVSPGSSYQPGTKSGIEVINVELDPKDAGDMIYYQMFLSLMNRYGSLSLLQDAQGQVLGVVTESRTVSTSY